MQTIAVRTTQNVFIHYPIASVGERILGHLIDRLILIIYSIALVAFFIRIELKVIWIWIVFLGFPWLFFTVLFEIFMNGQTPGKILMKIQVVRLDGTRATIGNFVLRWIFGFIDFYILGGAIGVILIAAGGKGQRLGDLVATTTVVKLTERKDVTARDVFISAEDNYSPTFEQVVQLRSSDIELMQRALEADRYHNNSEPLLVLSEKIKSQLGIQSDLPPQVFVRTLIKDYSHFTSRG
jgi:uncharacterized RDD family membrane protein YckC